MVILDKKKNPINAMHNNQLLHNKEKTLKTGEKQMQNLKFRIYLKQNHSSV
jgi:hypothetical protein